VEGVAVMYFGPHFVTNLIRKQKSEAKI